MIFLSTPTQETDAISALGEDLKELQEFGKPDVLMDALKGWVPDLIRFGLNLLVILVIFIVGRKIIRLLLKMARHSFERAGMEIGVTKFIGFPERAADFYYRRPAGNRFRLHCGDFRIRRPGHRPGSPGEP